MPRYFFHVMDGKAIVDNVGTELDDNAHARREAIRTAGAILADGDLSNWQGRPWMMTVAGEDGIAVLTLRFQADDHGTNSAAAESA